MKRRAARKRIYKRKTRGIRRRRFRRRGTNNGVRYFKYITMAALNDGITYVDDNPSADTHVFANCKKMFGYYRVHAVKLQWIPLFNSFDVNNSSKTNVPQIVYHDWNQTTGTGTVTRDLLATQESAKFMDMSRKWTRYIRFVKTMATSVSARFDGYIKTEEPVATQRVYFSTAGPGAIQMGVLRSIYYISFKQRTF